MLIGPNELVLNVHGWKFHLNLSNLPPFHTVPIKGRAHLFSDSRAAKELGRLTSDYDVIHAHGIRAAWIASLACHKTAAICASPAADHTDVERQKRMSRFSKTRPLLPTASDEGALK